ncbi:MAG: DUF1573 domain-containing protein [Rikenellaceae bacterium]|nr:DUF1573 domain-containing protein [Rikenellaceae bacterium]
MKHILTVVVLLLLGRPDGVLSFEQESLGLGRVRHKSRTEVVFRFSNNGEKPIVITGAETACGCTKVDFSSKPVMEGCSDSLTVRFHAIDKGAFYKKITLTTTGGRHTIAIKGVVE